MEKYAPYTDGIFTSMKMKIQNRVLSRMSDTFESRLINATRSRDEKQVVKLCHEYDFDVNTEFKFGYTLLYYSVLFDNFKLVEFLLQQRVMIHAGQADAMITLSSETIKKILEEYFYENVIPIQPKLKKRKRDQRLLLKRKSDVSFEYQNKCDSTIFNFARAKDVFALDNSLKVFKFDITKRNSKGFTLLMVAAGCSSGEMVESIICRGALRFINSRSTREGFTALMIAILTGNIPAANKLLNHGASVKIQDLKGRTALDFSRTLGLDSLTKRMC